MRVGGADLVDTRVLMRPSHHVFLQGNLSRYPSYNLRVWLERVTSPSPFAGVEHGTHVESEARCAQAPWQS